MHLDTGAILPCNVVARMDIVVLAKGEKCYLPLYIIIGVNIKAFINYLSIRQSNFNVCNNFKHVLSV